MNRSSLKVESRRYKSYNCHVFISSQKSPLDCGEYGCIIGRLGMVGPAITLRALFDSRIFRTRELCRTAASRPNPARTAQNCAILIISLRVESDGRAARECQTNPKLQNCTMMMISRQAHPGAGEHTEQECETNPRWQADALIGRCKGRRVTRNKGFPSCVH